MISSKKQMKALFNLHRFEEIWYGKFVGESMNLDFLLFLKVQTDLV